MPEELIVSVESASAPALASPVISSLHFTVNKTIQSARVLNRASVRSVPLNVTYQTPLDGDVVVRTVDDRCFGSLRTNRDRPAKLILLEDEKEKKTVPQYFTAGEFQEDDDVYENKECSPADNWARILSRSGSPDRVKAGDTECADSSVGIKLLRILSGSKGNRTKISKVEIESSPVIVRRHGEEGVYIGGHKRYHPKLELIASEVAASPYFVPVEQPYPKETLQIVDVIHRAKYENDAPPRIKKPLQRESGNNDSEDSRPDISRSSGKNNVEGTKTSHPKTRKKKMEKLNIDERVASSFKKICEYNEPFHRIKTKVFYAPIRVKMLNRKSRFQITKPYMKETVSSKGALISRISKIATDLTTENLHEPIIYTKRVKASKTGVNIDRDIETLKRIKKGNVVRALDADNSHEIHHRKTDMGFLTVIDAELNTADDDHEKMREHYYLLSPPRSGHDDGYENADVSHINSDDLRTLPERAELKNYTDDQIQDCLVRLLTSSKKSTELETSLKRHLKPIDDKVPKSAVPVIKTTDSKDLDFVKLDRLSRNDSRLNRVSKKEKKQIADTSMKKGSPLPKEPYDILQVDKRRVIKSVSDSVMNWKLI